MTSVQVLPFDSSLARTVEAYDARRMTTVALGSGSGEAHVSVARFEPGGDIGAHVTGFGQLFIVVEGGGWVSGDDGVRVPVATGQAAFFPRGRRHSKGSDTGMTAVMVQVFDLVPEGA